MVERQIYETLIERLLEEGIKIQIYESVTTNSYYIKMDYGVLRSIRISDHKGLKHLKYKYNIGSYITQEGYRQRRHGYFYRAENSEKLMKNVLRDRTEKKRNFGSKYEKYMVENKQKSEGKKGFWGNSTEIKDQRHWEILKEISH